LLGILREATLTSRKADVRVVPISGERHTPERPPTATGPWLFYPELGPTPSRKDAFRVYKNALRAMRRCLGAAGLPPYFGLHSLRHTFGSGLVSAGVSPAYVQQQMGHRSIAQTIDTYGSWLPVRVAGAVDDLAESFALGRGHQMDTEGLAEASKTG
jgi:integrase